MTLTHQTVNSLLTEEVSQIPGALSAILVSADGLLRAASSGVDTEDGERWAAAVSGLQSLSRNSAGFARSAPEHWDQTLVSYQGGQVLLTAAGAGSFIAFAADDSADPGIIAFRSAKLVDRLGAVTASPARSGPGHPA